mmetsp:Transcript_91580/g.200753  ORF Transcript_91580/g.200753 Transcript_91580/m.200753 type:complete len:299 (+) Transcript_91580:1547-2443(+)
MQQPDHLYSEEGKENASVKRRETLLSSASKSGNQDVQGAATNASSQPAFATAAASPSSPAVAPAASSEAAAADGGSEVESEVEGEKLKHPPLADHASHDSSNSSHNSTPLVLEEALKNSPLVNPPTFGLEKSSTAGVVEELHTGNGDGQLVKEGGGEVLGEKQLKEENEEDEEEEDEKGASEAEGEGAEGAGIAEKGAPQQGPSAAHGQRSLPVAAAFATSMAEDEDDASSGGEEGTSQEEAVSSSWSWPLLRKLFLGSILLQVMLLRLSAHMAGEAHGKRNNYGLRDLLTRTDYNQG